MPKPNDNSVSGRRGQSECPELLAGVMRNLEWLPEMARFESEFRETLNAPPYEHPLIILPLTDKSLDEALYNADVPGHLEWLSYSNDPNAPKDAGEYRSISRFLYHLPDETREFFLDSGRGMAGPEIDRLIAESYFIFRAWDRNLRRLGEGYRRWKKTGREQFRRQFRLTYEGSIWIGENGELRDGQADALVRALRSVPSKDLWRAFGVCKKETCKGLFWIARADKEYCSGRCGNVERQRRVPKEKEIEAVETWLSEHPRATAAELSKGTNIPKEKCQRIQNYLKREGTRP